MGDTSTFEYMSNRRDNGPTRRGQHMRKHRKTTARIAKGVINFPVSVKEDMGLTNKDELRVTLKEDKVSRKVLGVLFRKVKRGREGTLLFHEFKSGGGWVYISGFLREFGYNPDTEAECPFVTIIDREKGVESVLVTIPEEWRYDYDL